MSSLLALNNSASSFNFGHGLICTDEEIFQLPDEKQQNMVVIQSHLENKNNGEDKIQNLLDYLNKIHGQRKNYLFICQNNEKSYEINEIEIPDQLTRSLYFKEQLNSNELGNLLSKFKTVFF